MKKGIALIFFFFSRAHNQIYMLPWIVIEINGKQSQTVPNLQNKLYSPIRSKNV